MYELSQIVIIIGMIIMLINTIRCIWYFYIDKDVIVANEGLQGVMTIIMIGLSFLGVLFFGAAFFLKIADTITGWMLFFTSLIYTVTITWVLSLLDSMKSRTMSIIEVIVGVIEAGDQNLEGHSLHVKSLAILIYDYLPNKYKLKINEENLEYAAILLDLGKLGVPRDIIDKVGKLKKDEWEIMKRHPEIGVKILEPISSFKAISNWILYHHERVDGTGYHNLKKDEIPLASRIIAVADTYSALTMERSYKASLSYEDAVAELKMVAGTQLDKEIVDVFCDIPKATVEACMNEVKQKMLYYSEENFRF